MVKSILKFIIPAQMAVSGPPLGPALGQSGVPAGEFCKRFNELSASFKKGVLLRVNVVVMVDRTFRIEIKDILLTKYILESTGNSKGSSKGAVLFSNSLKKPITNMMLFELLKSKQMNANLYKSFIGTCKSMGLLVIEYKK